MTIQYIVALQNFSGAYTSKSHVQKQVIKICLYFQRHTQQNSFFMVYHSVSSDKSLQICIPSPCVTPLLWGSFWPSALATVNLFTCWQLFLFQDIIGMEPHMLWLLRLALGKCVCCCVSAVYFFLLQRSVPFNRWTTVR